MPISRVSPSPEFCEYSEVLKVAGYKTTVENAYFDARSQEVSIDLFAIDDRYVQTLDIQVDSDELPSNFKPTREWIMAHAPAQVVQDHLLRTHRQPSGTLH